MEPAAYVRQSELHHLDKNEMMVWEGASCQLHMAPSETVAEEKLLSKHFCLGHL
jgi:hypothetical protein